jgi:hypothetical protein
MYRTGKRVLGPCDFGRSAVRMCYRDLHLLVIKKGSNVEHVQNSRGCPEVWACAWPAVLQVHRLMFCMVCRIPARACDPRTQL